MGKSTVLVSDYGHLGGMTSSGLGYTDLGDPAILGGISREFYHRVYLHYQDDSAWDIQSKDSYSGGGQGSAAFDTTTELGTVFEPKVAEQIFNEMAAEAGVTVIEGRMDLTNGVTMNGTRIQTLHLTSGTDVQAKMFVDAGYEGDLMAAAGVSFTVGREANSTYSESVNGIRGAGSENQLYDGIDPYVVKGDSSSGLLPGVNADRGGETGAADHRLQAYCYRMVLTDVAANRVAVEKPADYNRDDYELLFRSIDDAGQTGYFFKLSMMPNRKTDSNNNGGISTDYIGMNYGDDWDWTTLNYEEREALAARHRDWQLGLIWTLQNDSGIPQTIRDSYAKWGLPADEFTDNGHWPYNLYIREARRMVSDFVMTEKYCLNRLPVTDSVGMGAYTLDSHNTQRFVYNGMVKNEGDVQRTISSPYPISYRALTPKTNECENLLVPWALSASHIAFGSIRMEPVFMNLAQSSATAAAIAIDDDISVQDVDYKKLSLQLRANGQVLLSSAVPFDQEATIITDSEDSETTELTGVWSVSTSTGGYNGLNYLHDNNTDKGSKSVKLTPTLSEADNYKVYLRWTSADNRASNVPVTIVYQGGTTNLTVNQQSNGGEWNLLGEWPFIAGTNGYLTIANAGTDGYVIADAAAWAPESSTRPALSVLATDSQLTEGSTNDTGKLTLLRTQNTNDALTITIEYSGSATAGTDYTELPTNIIFAAGQTTTNLDVSAVNDNQAEGDELLTATIQPSTDYMLGPQSNATITIHDAPFDAWRFNNFTPEQLLDNSTSGAAADPDHDGIRNLAEFFANSNPTSQDSSGPYLTLAQSNNQYVITLKRNPNASSLPVSLEESSTITSWTPAAAQEAITPDYPWEILDFTVTSTNEIKFWRVRIQDTEP
jgi:hypothetical protein